MPTVPVGATWPSFSPCTQLCLPPDVSEMQQLTKEPYRWDQRLFTIMLKLPGVGPASEDCLPGEVALSSLCEDTGGVCVRACVRACVCVCVCVCMCSSHLPHPCVLTL